MQSAEHQAAVELVRLAQEQGLSLRASRREIEFFVDVDGSERSISNIIG